VFCLKDTSKFGYFFCANVLIAVVSKKTFELSGSKSADG
jgi:hypothetical protein